MSEHLSAALLFLRKGQYKVLLKCRKSNKLNKNENKDLPVNGSRL